MRYLLLACIYSNKLKIKVPGKPVVTVRNSDIAKFGTELERQTPLNAYAVEGTKIRGKIGGVDPKPC